MTTTGKLNQHWVMVGSATASQKVWGLDRIQFPCGFSTPAQSFVASGEPIVRPEKNESCWIMGGFAFELRDGGKNVKKNEAAQMIAGYRLWLSVFHHTVRDELERRGHTVLVWDQGVSLFHGLWQDKGQALGELLPPKDFAPLSNHETWLAYDETKVLGESASAYTHRAEEIISFMSEFMTLEAGDIYVQGPLVASEINRDINMVALTVGGVRLEAALADRL